MDRHSAHPIGESNPIARPMHLLGNGHHKCAIRYGVAARRGKALVGRPAGSEQEEGGLVGGLGPGKGAGMAASVVATSYPFS